MLNLNHLTDEALISETKRLVREESERLAILLSHLNEIERRRLYTNFQCETIHEYAMKELKYSRDEAQRRVTAMFAIRGVPEVEEGIKSGELSLTHITYAQSLFSNEEDKGRKFDAEKKAEVFQSIAGLSTRERKSRSAHFRQKRRRFMTELNRSAMAEIDSRSKATMNFTRL